MTRPSRLERLQVLVYLAAIAAGLALGVLAPAAGAAVGVAVLPALAVLLFVTLLVVPCTDWLLTFTQLAGGDTARAVAFAPVSLIVQLALLPVYVWLIADGAAGADVGALIDVEQVVVTVLVVLVLPLALAVPVRVLPRIFAAPPATTPL